jgi:hypothetical protein
MISWELGNISDMYSNTMHHTAIWNTLPCGVPYRADNLTVWNTIPCGLPYILPIYDGKAENKSRKLRLFHHTLTVRIQQPSPNNIRVC